MTIIIFITSLYATSNSINDGNALSGFKLVILLFVALNSCNDCNPAIPSSDEIELYEISNVLKELQHDKLSIVSNLFRSNLSSFNLCNDEKKIGIAATPFCCSINDSKCLTCLISSRFVI